MGYCILASFVFVCDVGVNDHFLGVIVKRFSHMLDFTVVEPLSVDESPDLCDELTGPFYSLFFLLCE